NGAIDNTPTPGENLLLFEYNGSSVFGDVAGQLSFTFGQFYTRHVTPYVTTPTVDWRDGNWHNIAIVIDFQNDTARLWIDGVEQVLSYIDYAAASGGLIADGADAFTADGHPLLIGPGHTTNEGFDSSASHFTMWDRALTQGDLDLILAAWRAEYRDASGSAGTIVGDASHEVRIPEIRTATGAVGTVGGSADAVEAQSRNAVGTLSLAAS